MEMPKNWIPTWDVGTEEIIWLHIRTNARQKLFPEGEGALATRSNAARRRPTRLRLVFQEAYDADNLSLGEPCSAGWRRRLPESALNSIPLSQSR